jgi:hypothetical protein
MMHAVEVKTAEGYSQMQELAELPQPRTFDRDHHHRHGPASFHNGVPGVRAIQGPIVCQWKPSRVDADFRYSEFG